MRKEMIVRKFAVCAAALALAVGFAACTPKAPSDSETAQKAGSILLSVNPEFEIEYDDQGIVIEIKGVNEDANALKLDFDSLEGEKCAEALSVIVEAIHAKGYFSAEIDGHTKNIVIKLDADSAYPDDDFLDEIEKAVRAAVKECSLDSSTLLVPAEELDDKGYIGLDKAKEIVLAQLGLANAVFYDHEYELDDGIYEFEFDVNGVTYDYEMDARSGKVLDADMEQNDDWDDRDSWDDDDDVDDRDDDINDLDDDIDDRDDDIHDRDDDINDRDDDVDDRDDDNDDD